MGIQRKRQDKKVRKFRLFYNNGQNCVKEFNSIGAVVAHYEKNQSVMFWQEEQEEQLQIVVL